MVIFIFAARESRRQRGRQSLRGARCGRWGYTGCGGGSGRKGGPRRWGNAGRRRQGRRWRRSCRSSRHQGWNGLGLGRQSPDREKYGQDQDKDGYEGIQGNVDIAKRRSRPIASWRGGFSMFGHIQGTNCKLFLKGCKGTRMNCGWRRRTPLSGYSLNTKSTKD